MFTFVIGKGGVGKSTVSSAFALWRGAREPRKKVLLLSIDPAHSLSDILETRIGERPVRLKTVGRVYASALDASTTVSAFLQEQQDDILSILEGGSLFTREELAPFLSTALPGTSELGALLAIDKLAGSGYDEIVIDTAPLGHTLRLFEMPAHMERLLKLVSIAAGRDRVLAEHFGGRAQEDPRFLRWKSTITRVLRALGRGGSKIILVTSPESFSLQESIRAIEQLRSGGSGWTVDEIVLNRVVDSPGTCQRCARHNRQANAARRFLTRNLPDIPVRQAADPGNPIQGIEALSHFGRHVFEGKKLRLGGKTPPPRLPALRLRAAEWPTMDVPLTLTAGKGGVGKTTISAGIAYRTRRKTRMPVAICSVDPAPSLDDIFETDIGDEPRPVLGDRKLLATEVDAVAEYTRWAGEMQLRVRESMTTEVQGIHLDLSFERELLSAVLEIVPPGVDEILAIFRILDYVERGTRVQIDMAPTGHALEVLQTPARLLAWTRLLLKTLARHRTLPLAQDAAVELAGVSERVRRLNALLADRERSRLWVVMLAEPLPDRETRSLVSALKSMSVPAAGLFVNRILLRKPEGCARCGRTWQGQRRMLHSILDMHLPVYVVPEYPAEIKGRRGLERLTRQLWELQQNSAR